MDKLQAMKQQVEEIKKRLDTIIVEGQAEGIIVKSNGNRKLTDIFIPEELSNDTDALQDLVLTAANRALGQAERVHDSEMASSAQGILPNFPGIGG